MPRPEDRQDSAASPEADDKRALEHGSSNSTADYAVEGRPSPEDRFIEAPHARHVEPLAEGEKPDQLAAKVAETEALEDAQDDRQADRQAGGPNPLA